MDEQLAVNECDKQSARAIPVDVVISPEMGRMLVASVRDTRRLGLKPNLILSRSDFRTLLDYWPQFYLAGPVVETRAGNNICSWLRRLGQFLVRKRRASPLPSVQFSAMALDRIKGQMLRMQAIPVDGVWVPVSIIGGNNG